MQEKAATMKRFEYSLLGKDTIWHYKETQKLDSTYEYDKITRKEKPAFKKYNRSNLIYNMKHSFWEYYNTKNFFSLSFTSKYPILLLFYSDLEKFNNLNPKKRKHKKNCVW